MKIERTKIQVLDQMMVEIGERAFCEWRGCRFR